MEYENFDDVFAEKPETTYESFDDIFAEAEEQPEVEDLVAMQGLKRGFGNTRIANSKLLAGMAKEISREKRERAERLKKIEEGPSFIENVKVIPKIVKNLATFSTTPSKPYTEAVARHTKEGEASFDVEQTLGSTVNLVKSLWPGGTTPQEALRDFSTKDPEGARTFLKNMYSKNIINEYGLVNYDSVQYSDIKRYMQNELIALWATQRSGVQNIELFRKILASRGGVTSDDSMVAAGIKRAGQMIDGAAFNIPSQVVLKSRMGEDLDLYDKPKKGAGEGKSLAEERSDFSFKYTEPVQVNGKWVVPEHKDLGGGDVVIEDYDPTAPPAERKRQVARAVFEDTVQKLEYQAMEEGPQILDPTILIGVGLGKKVAQALVKSGGRTGARVGRMASAISPYSKEGGGAIGALASVGKVPFASKAIVRAAQSDTLTGAAIRGIDRVATTTALVSGLAGLGSPTNAGIDSAITSGLMSLGLSPLTFAGAAHPVGYKDKNAIREILNSGGDVNKMSNYSRKFFNERLSSTGLKPDELMNSLKSAEALTIDLPRAMNMIESSETTTTQIMEMLRRMSGDKKFQETANKAVTPFDNYGRSWEGVLASNALEYAIRQQDEHLNRVKQSPAGTTGTGPTSVPLASQVSQSLAGLKAAAEALPTRVLNDEKLFETWLNDNINNTTVMRDTYKWGNLPTISDDAAKMILAQWKAVDRTEAYLPLAHTFFVVGTVLKEQAPAMKLVAVGEQVENFKDLADMYRKADPDEVSALLANLSGLQKGGEETLVGRLLRHRQKSTNDIISPSLASVKLVEDLEDATLKVVGKQQERKMIKEAFKLQESMLKKADPKYRDTPQYQQLVQDRDAALIKINEDIHKLSQGTMLARIQDHAQDAQKKITLHQKKLADALSETTEAIEKTSMDIAGDIKDRKQKGTRKYQDRLVEQSRRRSMEDVTKLEQQVHDFDSRIDKLEEHNKELMKEMRVLSKTPHYTDKQIADYFRQVSRKHASRSTLTPERKIYLDYSNNNALIKRKQRQKVDLKNDIAANLSSRPSIEAEAQLRNSLAHTLPKDYGVWVDEALPGARSLGLFDTGYFQSMLRTVKDNLDSNRQISAGQPGPHVFLDDMEIALFRHMGNESLWKLLGHDIPESQKPLFREFGRRVNAVADLLVQTGKDSLIADKAFKRLQAFANDPARGKLRDLIDADIHLHKHYFTDKILREGAAKNYGVTLDALLSRVREGKLHLTRQDYNNIRALVTDSAIGKSYVTTRELEGLGFEPWMIPYKQDVVVLLDNLLTASSENIDRILAETRKFLYESGQISAPDKFNETVATAYLFGSVNNVGASSENGLFNLFSMANAWRERTSVADFPFLQTEQYALALDRKTGLGVEQDMRNMFAGANASAKARDDWMRPLAIRLRSIRSGKESYQDHMKPSSPVRNFINHILTGTKDRSFIETVFTEFYSHGKHHTDSIFSIKADRAGMKPEDAVYSDRAYLTDHLIVDGELTTLGQIADEVHKNIGIAEPWEVIDKVLNSNKFVDQEKRRRHPDEFKKLRDFVQLKLSGRDDGGYGVLRNKDQWELVKTATSVIQRHDKEGLQKLAELTAKVNKEQGTSYPPIDYNPWRLDTDTVTYANAVAQEVGMLGSWRDADRFAGNRFATSPDAQIKKAIASGLDQKDIAYGPEMNYIQRYTRLYNDVLVRKSRKSLADKALFSEVMGRTEIANIIRDKLIGAANIGRDSMPWHQRLGLRLSGSDNAAMVASGLIARNVFNPMIMLARASNILLEQPMQQALLGLGENPNLRTLKQVVMDAVRYEKAMIPSWFGGMAKSLVMDTEYISKQANDGAIKVSGKHVALLEELYAGFTKRIDPYAQEFMKELNRGGSAGAKKASLLFATGRFAPEAAASRMLWTMKEQAENVAGRSTLQILGGVMEQSEKILKDKGEAELFKYLGGFFGASSNPTLIHNTVRLLKEGRIEEGWKLFGNAYLASRVGTWNHTNVPIAIRSMAHWLPGADQFYTASMIGTHRAMSAIMGMADMPPNVKARMVGSLISILAISSGLGMLGATTGLDYFQRISPIGVWSSAVRTYMDDEKARNIYSALATVGTRAEIRSGVSHSQTLRALYSLIGLTNNYMFTDYLSVGKTDKDRAQTEDNSIRDLMAALSDMTVVRPVMSSTGHTMREVFNVASYMAEPETARKYATAMSTVAQEDLNALAISIGMDIGKATELRNKLVEADGRNETPFNNAEELQIAILGLWIDAMSSANDKLWAEAMPAYSPAKHSSGAYATDERVRRLYQGLRAGSPAAEKLLSMTERAIARYEAKKARYTGIAVGASEPVVDARGLAGEGEE
jgi:hypothetical protein